MRKFYSLAFICCFLITYSCKAPEEEESIDPAKLYGTWSSISYYIKECEISTDNKSTRPFYNCDAEGCLIYTFNEDGTVEVRTHSEPASGRVFPGTYTLDRNTLTVCTFHFTDCWVFELTLDEETKKDLGIIRLWMQEENSGTTGCSTVTTYEK